VRLALTQLKKPFEYQAVNILQGETHEPWFLQKNPAGQIPLLELDDGTYLSESTAMLFLVAEGSELLPAQGMDRIRVQQWIAFEQSCVDRVISRARFRRLFPQVVPTAEAEYGPWLRDGHRALGVMEQHLARRRYFVAERYTIADIALYSYIHCAHEGGFDLSSYPRVLAWLERVRSEPGHLRIDEQPG
jgi:glutathione S-transferase